jgi:hypothetical protein
MLSLFYSLAKTNWISAYDMLIKKTLTGDIPIKELLDPRDFFIDVPLACSSTTQSILRCRDQRKGISMCEIKLR